jgi:hypothetical protein
MLNHCTCLIYLHASSAPAAWAIALHKPVPYLASSSPSPTFLTLPWPTGNSRVTLFMTISSNATGASEVVIHIMHALLALKKWG